MPKSNVVLMCRIKSKETEKNHRTEVSLNKNMHMKKVDLVLETDDNITILRWAKMAEKVSQIGDKPSPSSSPR